jgi:TonB family protein
MSSEVVSRDWVGRVVDETFVLSEWLGGTERSGVFVTEMPGAEGQKATIKLIEAEGVGAEERIRGWQAASTLSHPHLVDIFGTGRCQFGEAQFAYIVTEYAEEVLSSVLTERALTADETRGMLEPVLDALSFLHAKGFVHGHVKPSNLLAVNDQLKLSADGLMRAGDMRKSKQPPDIHRAPESISGTAAPAADVWSLGVTVVEALSQRPPEWNQSANAEPIVAASIPEPFAEIARKSLRVDPAKRCTMGTVKGLLAGEIKPGALAALKSSAEQRPELEAKTAARLIPIAEPIAAPDSVLRVADAEPPRNIRVVPIVLAVTVVMAIIVAIVVHSLKTESPAPEEVQVTQGGSVQVPQGGSAKGAVLEQVMPAVPQKASATIHGVVLLTVRVKADEAGKVTNATLASPGPSKYFGKLAIEASRAWRFKPAQQNGRAVPSTWMLHYQFRADGIKVTPAEEAP